MTTGSEKTEAFQHPSAVTKRVPTLPGPLIGPGSYLAGLLDTVSWVVRQWLSAEQRSSETVNRSVLETGHSINVRLQSRGLLESLWLSVHAGS